MKVIDLLNKIANGEEVPKKIKWKGVIFDYVEEENYEDYINFNCCSLFEHFGDKNEIYKVTNMLNDEIEIIEEKKIPEKIKSNGKEFYCDSIDSWIDKEKTSAYCEYLMNKYNDLIDYLHSKGDE